MNLRFTKNALKQLRVLEKRIARRVLRDMTSIAADPFAPHANVTVMKGSKDVFRLRVGDWRAGYAVDREADTVTVLWVRPRGDAYR